MPCIVPPSEIEVEKSLGSILSAPNISENIVKYNMTTLKHHQNLSIIGMLKSENEYTYAPYTQVQAEQLIDCLREIAPIVIVDCSSYIANDVLSAVALKEADDVLRLVNCDLKSISYLASQIPLIQNSGFDLDKQYKVISNIKEHHEINQMLGTLGSTAFQIPHSIEVEKQFLDGNLLCDLQLKNSRTFKAEISKICKEVFYC